VGNVVMTAGGGSSGGVAGGAMVPLVTSKVLERDTVSPGEPVISNTLNGDILGQTLSLSVTGEANTIATIKVGIVGETTKVNQVYGYRLDDNGKFSTSNLLGQLTCDTSYSLDITLTDRAGNVSKGLNNTFRTMTCPVCPVYKVIDKSNETVTQGASNGKYRVPIRGAAAPVGLQVYGTPRTLDGRSWQHEGVDFNGAGNPPTYSIGTGVVVFAGVNGAYGNMVKVDHQNGTRSEYGHLKSISVSKGQSVSIDTQLGIVGSTGNSFGDHLHLNINVNGKQVNPLTVLDTNYSYSPTVVEGNNRYAVLQLSPGTLSVDEARRFGCDVPSLPRDPALDSVYDFGGGGYGGEGEDFIEIGELDSNQIDIKVLINDILRVLQGDISGYSNLTKCMSEESKCSNSSIPAVENLKKFLEHLFRGILKGLQNTAQDLYKQFIEFSNQIISLLYDPIKTILEIGNKVGEIWKTIQSLIGDISKLTQLLFKNISDFFDKSSDQRIEALGKSIGLFAGDRLATSLQGALTGGPIGAIALTLTKISEKVSEPVKFSIKSSELVNKSIKIYSKDIKIIKNKNFKTGADYKELLAIESEDIKKLNISSENKTLLLDLKTFKYPKYPNFITDKRVKHIIAGDDTGGGHLYNALTGNNSYKAYNKGVPDKYGVYQMDYEFVHSKKGLQKKTNHTMFPDNWDAQKTMDEITNAFNDPNRKLISGNLFSGKASNGMEIRFAIYNNPLDTNNFGKIITAYPIKN
jgi:Peptidase family M23/Bacterial EndoU nuclease